MAFGVLADTTQYFANGEEGREISFGTGSDGAFSDGPTQTGISVVAFTITFDTSVKSVFNFSSFTLSAPFTIQVNGSSPLTIRVTGDTTIAGTINLVGNVGGASGVSITGGAARGGGQSGGDGATFAGASPTNGSPTSGSAPRGGLAGANQVAITGTQQAGGGGCNGSGAAAGGANAGSAGPCSLTQTTIARNFDSQFLGGGGGAGGATYTGGGADRNAAGGGGGGGAIRISSFGNMVISAGSLISAIGGAGGAASVGATDCGAAGGGGSGGSIWLQTAGNLSGTGTLNVTLGAGGADGICANPGGNGSRGVIRLDTGTNSFTGTFTPAGSADALFTVIPVITVFNLEGGSWLCGRTQNKNTLPSFVQFLFFIGLIIASQKLKGRRAS